MQLFGEPREGYFGGLSLASTQLTALGAASVERMRDAAPMSHPELDVLGGLDEEKNGAWFTSSGFT